MSSRRQKSVRRDRQVPLLVVAGLPERVITAAIKTVEREREPWRVIARTFPEADAEIYARENSILELLRETCVFAEVQRSKTEKPIPAPSRIVLAYVAAPGSARLISAFGHSVYPVQLNVQDWHWPRGKHWRHQIELVVGQLKHAITLAESPAIHDLKLRLEARRKDDVLLLPGRNFHINGGRLQQRFREMLLGNLMLEEVERDIETRRFPFEALSDFYARVGGQNKSFAVDARGLVFAISERAFHGNTWTIEPTVNYSENDLRLILEGLYRFGMAIPSGFQHDVQWEGQRNLNQEIFDCSKDGVKDISGTHANVYGNDVVRPPNQN